MTTTTAAITPPTPLLLMLLRRLLPYLLAALVGLSLAACKPADPGIGTAPAVEQASTVQAPPDPPTDANQTTDDTEDSTPPPMHCEADGSQCYWIDTAPADGTQR